MNIEEKLLQEIEQLTDAMIESTVEMVKIPSETPPSDTREMAKYLHEYLQQIPGVELEFHTLEEPIHNLVAVIRSGKPGKRLIFNGHMDTYPAGNADKWADSPWSGKIIDDFIYGRGSSDMKAGIACFIAATHVLANNKDLWNGEIVLTLAGDEESMGKKGTKFLLDTVPEASGDAMICADVGAPNALRFGQKGLLWFKLEAEGRAAHGAHVQKGDNAINKLMAVSQRINEEIPNLDFEIPSDVKDAILKGAEISEINAGKGETQILQDITVNIGTFEGGISPNLVPDYATAAGDIRIPAGATVEQIDNKLKEIAADFEGVTYTLDRSYEANWSDINHEIFDIVKRQSEKILDEEVVVTYRVGASDARHYRIEKDIPTINCGLTPYNLGAPDEHVSIDEMKDIAKIHLLSAYEFLK